MSGGINSPDLVASIVICLRRSRRKHIITDNNVLQIGLSHWSTIIVSYYSNTGTRDLVALFWPAPSILFWTRETIRSNYHHSILNCNKVIKHTYLATLMYKHGKRINPDSEYRKMDLLLCL